MNIISIGKTALGLLSKYSPEIMVGGAIVGIITGTILAIKSKSKADAKMEELKRKASNEYSSGVRTSPEPRVTEKIRVLLTAYLSTIVIETASIASIIGAMVIKNKRYQAVMAALSFSAETVKTYQQMLKDKLGPDEAKKIDAAVRENVTNEHTEHTNTIATGSGKTLIRDGFGGGYFYSSKDEVEKALLIAINNALAHGENELYISTLYDNLGLEETQASYINCWYICNPDDIHLYWRPYSTPDGLLCWEFTFAEEPKAIYRY